MCRRMGNGDLESGQYGDDELTNIRVDRSYPSECESTTAYQYPPLQQEPGPAPYQAPGTSKRLKS